MSKFRKYVNEYLMDIERGSRIVSIGDMNRRVGNNEAAGVVEKWDVVGVNENGEYLVRKESSP